MSEYDIKDITPQLSVSFEPAGWAETNEEVAVLLITPNVSNVYDHYHIELTREQVIALEQWCASFLRRQTYD